jgi:GNAT superfamily N-acetyltransferase
VSDLLIRPEPYSGWHELAEAQGAFEAHWREVEHHHDQVPLAIDHDAYLHLERLGLLYCAVARDKWRIAGYTVWMLGPSLHHRTIRQAQCDAIYVAPEYRPAGTADRLLEQALVDLKASAVTLALLPTSRRKPLGGWLKRHGFAAQGEIHGRLL